MNQTKMLLGEMDYVLYSIGRHYYLDDLCQHTTKHAAIKISTFDRKDIYYAEQILAAGI